MAEDVICHFNLLPLQTVYEILNWIPFCEKKKARLVCHEWRAMIDSQPSVVFRAVLSDNTSMKYFLQSYRSMDNVLIQNINKRKSKNAFGNSEFPRVKNAELGWKNSEGNIERFFTRGCEFAESLTLGEFSLERISRGAISKALSEIDWSHLTRFNVMVTSPYYNEKDTKTGKHLRNMTAALKYARIPSLQELDFNFDFCYEFAKKHKRQYQKLFMGLWTFLESHSKTLKMLIGRVISTTRQRILEIPEIPMDIQQSLVSNMKLKQFGLTLYSVQRIQSILNPALFGTELKILSIALWESFGRNLELLFEKNGKTLTKVSWDLPNYPLTLLEKCTSLESLEFGSTFVSRSVVPEDPSRISHIKLKSFSARYMFDHNDVSPGLLQLLNQSVGTLEHLTLFNTPDHRHRPIQFWLRDFVALKTIQIHHISPNYIEENMGGQFPHLTELKALCITNENRRIIATWIAESMRNIEMIAIITPYMDIQFCRSLLTLPRLKRIIFPDREGWGHGSPLNAIEEIKEFCKAPAVTLTTLEDGSKFGCYNYRKTHVININRTPLPNPVSN